MPFGLLDWQSPRELDEDKRSGYYYTFDTPIEDSQIMYKQMPYCDIAARSICV